MLVNCEWRSSRRFKVLLFPDKERGSGEDRDRLIFIQSLFSVETKCLWLQQHIKSGSLGMEGVATLLNISGLGTKKLTDEAEEMFLDVPHGLGGV